MSISSSVHKSVLLDEVILSFSVGEDVQQEPKVVFDGTLGGAGHSGEILSRFPKVKLVACDRDVPAIERAKETLKSFNSRFLLVHSSFSEIEQILNSQEVREFCSNDDLKFDRILLDLGISSDQLDSRERGFSFKSDGLLDMRMDQSQGMTASDVVNNYSKPELIRMFKKGGVGPQALYLANQILKRRPIHTCSELSEICQKVYRENAIRKAKNCLLYTSPSPRD